MVFERGGDEPGVEEEYRGLCGEGDVKRSMFSSNYLYYYTYQPGFDYHLPSNRK